ncbi:FkbM family methyltransferase [Geomesophilobacter sediminis]|uniref:FkbM family methyltransferase n=1 Tax=Geomesophilobacter sediminis TaxID=2798584 RepID=A0A8J7LUS7_9BACT|nr:FkbM family methyltransferase [Geomesophilobacter sediminis]MBJ6724075.1 FkbM family methyltransferase [Geomesophilobacter sediminis]
MITGDLFDNLIFAPLRTLRRLVTNSDYRHLAALECRYGFMPRYTEFTANAFGYEVLAPDAPSFLASCKEIFADRIYAFKFSDESPRILDLGANIGLSVLFFKKMYPNAEITAFEADPKIFHYLEKNVHGNGLSEVRLVNKAAWNKDTALRFRSEGADGGRAAWADDNGAIEVDAVDIGEFLDRHSFDFLKMDIEGSEEYVVPACRRHLGQFRHVFVEYHSRPGYKQCLDQILTILSDAGFRIHVHTLLSSPSPLFEIKSNSGFDLQLNIFASRN